MMTSLHRAYTSLKVVWRLKELAKQLGAMKRVAIELQNFDGSNLTEEDIDNALAIGLEKSEQALGEAVSLSKDLKGFLRKHGRK